MKIIKNTRKKNEIYSIVNLETPFLFRVLTFRFGFTASESFVSSLDVLGCVRCVFFPDSFVFPFAVEAALISRTWLESSWKVSILALHHSFDWLRIHQVSEVLTCECSNNPQGFGKSRPWSSVSWAEDFPMSYQDSIPLPRSRAEDPPQRRRRLWRLNKWFRLQNYTN